MRFGVVILPEQRWKDAKRRWELAEAYGFDHAWTYDHLGWRDLVDGPWFDGLGTLTAAASLTDRLLLGTHVASANFRHPVAFARELTTLDDYSGGRIIAGVGAGGGGFDSTVLGTAQLSPPERVDRFEEFVHLLDAILTTERTTWRGRYYSAVDARNSPGCLQIPRCPLIVAGNGPRSIALAASRGDGWMTTGSDQARTLKLWWAGIERRTRLFERHAREAERNPRALPRYLSLDGAPVYSLSGVSHFVSVARKAASLGFTDLVSHWPRPEGWFAGDEATLELVASLLPRLREL